jgi:hypothetical protein
MVVMVAIIVKLAIKLEPVKKPSRQTALSFTLSQSIALK